MNITVLLIGSNPIPNYVALSYLLRKDRDDTDIAASPDEVWMMYSKDTKVFADAIVRETKIEEKMVRQIDLGNEQRNENEIMKRFENTIAKKAGAGIEQINLVYTGGTKPMSVFSVMTFFDTNKLPDGFTKNINFIDIDPIAKILNVFPVIGDTKVMPSNSKKLDQFVKLSIESIIKLHQEKNEILPEKPSARLTSEEIQKVRELFLGNQSYNLRKENNDFTDIISIKKENDYKRKNGKNTDYSAVEGKYTKLKKTYPQLPDYPRFVDAEQCAFFLAGGWFEDYTLEMIENYMSSNNFKKEEYSIRKNVEILQKSLDSKINRKMEIDILLVIGYQLYLFSCTTDSSVSMIKQKSFEALYRANQLGGEHAKSIMVSLGGEYTDKETGRIGDVVKDVEQDFKEFDAARNLIILGKNDVKKDVSFYNKLNQIIGR